MTAALVAFLRRMLDDEQREAEEVLKRTTTTRRWVRGQWVEDKVQPPEWRRSMWPPERVLAEVAAKRAILTEYEKEAWVMEQGHRTGWTEGGQAVRLTMLRLWAGVYAGHPDFPTDA